MLSKVQKQPRITISSSDSSSYRFKLALRQNTKVVAPQVLCLPVKFQLKRSYRLSVMNFLLTGLQPEFLFDVFDFGLSFDHFNFRIKFWSKHESRRSMKYLSVRYHTPQLDFPFEIYDFSSDRTSRWRKVTFFKNHWIKSGLCLNAV